METTTASSHISPIATSLDIMESSPPPATFLKLEDLHNSPPPPAMSLDQENTTPNGLAPPVVIVQSKPAKKRKSWGQELPEPTTTLPPRKRAKTDDEKEQRRIERIKRNRAAAHNSRERKRQETEVLAVALARANAELDAYRSRFGALPSDVVLPEVHLSNDSVDTPAPSLIESHGSVDARASPESAADSFDYQVSIKQEPVDSAYTSPLGPALVDSMDAKPALLPPPLDQTQHSAVMLCTDLQCRSSRSRSSHNHLNLTSKPSSSSPHTRWWTALFLYLMTLQLQTCYKAVLLALWTLSPSRTARLMQASTLRLTSASTTSSTAPLLLSRLTRAMAQRNAATGRVPQQGALLALQRRSVVEARRRRVSAAAERVVHQTSGSDSMAFQELDRENRHFEHEDRHGEGDDGR